MFWSIWSRSKRANRLSRSIGSIWERTRPARNPTPSSVNSRNISWRLSGPSLSPSSTSTPFSIIHISSQPTAAASLMWPCLRQTARSITRFFELKGSGCPISATSIPICPAISRDSIIHISRSPMPPASLRLLACHRAPIRSWPGMRGTRLRKRSRPERSTTSRRVFKSPWTSNRTKRLRKLLNFPSIEPCRTRACPEGFHEKGETKSTLSNCTASAGTALSVMDRTHH